MAVLLQIVRVHIAFLEHGISRAPSCVGRLLALAMLGWSSVATASPTAEFDIPYQLRLRQGGTVLEVTGSFSWALPQNVQAMLAASPRVTVVQLESPGGHILPARELAGIIRQRGLATYVDRFCASACTLAFLGGHERWLAPNARLGFHQARAPGFPSEQANAYLADAYQSFAVPGDFIARVLRTSPASLWFPSRNDLQAAHFITSGSPPTIEEERSHDLREIVRSVQIAPDTEVVEFAATLSEILAELQKANPEACWSFAYMGSAEFKPTLPLPISDSVLAAEKQVDEAAAKAPTPMLSADQRKQVTSQLMGVIRAQRIEASLLGLRSGADHAEFCPSLRHLLELVLHLPDSQRVKALRVVLWVE